MFEKNNVVFEKKIQCEKYSLDVALKIYENMKNNLAEKVS